MFKKSHSIFSRIQQLSFVLSSALFLSFSANTVGAQDPTPGLSQFSESFKAAHIAHDYDRIASMVNWTSVRKPMRKKIEVYTTATFGLPIKNIEIEAVGDDKFKEVVLAGKRLKPNVPVSHVMRVHFELEATDPENTEKDTAVYLIGETEEAYQISVYVSAE